MDDNEQNREKSPISAFIASHKIIALFAVVLLGLPVLSIFPQMLPYKPIPMAPGEVVLFYGTAGAVVWAICAYILCRNDQIQDRESENRRQEEKEKKQHIPSMCLEIKSEKNGLLEYRLINTGKHLIKHVYIDDHYLTPCIKSEAEFDFALSVRSLPDDDYAKNHINSVVVDDIQCGALNEDGYPRNLYFYVDDVLDRRWRLGFCHSKNGRQSLYFEEEVVDAEA